ncbi:MAG: GNAT family N-acetyltransferase [Pseudomonadota bacterium]
MTPGRLFRALDATWAPADIVERDGWRLRRGAGGGKRVSAASPLSSDAAIDVAEAAMGGWGQGPLFQLTPENGALDQALAERGYHVVDPTLIYATPTENLRVAGSEVAKVLRGGHRIALVEEIWAKGGIGPERLAVMDRVAGPKSFILARLGDRPGAVGFVAVDGEVAMVHAVETLPHQRRKGAARMLMAGAARFAHEAGATTLALAVTEANEGANALYRALGMTVAARYHYRQAAT